jgi:hypothetical protein
MNIFNLHTDWLLNSVSVDCAVVARLDRVTPGLEDASCNASFLKEILNIFQLQSFSLGEEEIRYRNLFELAFVNREGQLYSGSLPMRNRSKRK